MKGLTDIHVANSTWPRSNSNHNRKPRFKQSQYKNVNIDRLYQKSQTRKMIFRNEEASLVVQFKFYLILWSFALQSNYFTRFFVVTNLPDFSQFNYICTLRVFSTCKNVIHGAINWEDKMVTYQWREVKSLFKNTVKISV